MKKFVPKAVYYEPKVREYELGKRLLKEYEKEALRILKKNEEKEN